MSVKGPLVRDTAALCRALVSWQAIIEEAKRFDLAFLLR